MTLSRHEPKNELRKSAHLYGKTTISRATASLIWTAERNGGQRTSTKSIPSGLTGLRVNFYRKGLTKSRPRPQGLRSWLGGTRNSLKTWKIKERRISTRSFL